MVKFSPINPSRLKPKPADSSLSFGKYFTDYMISCEFNNGKWGDIFLSEFTNLSLHPASSVLHYGSSVFEGLKAYRKDKDSVLLFRAEENHKRLNLSAKRLCLPEIDYNSFIKGVTALVQTDIDWVPFLGGTSLYIRPILFGTDETIGITPIKKASFVIMASPVGCYYPNGLQPVSILVEQNDVRAVKGGTGDIKCGGNYAGSLRATVKAKENGFDQVLWLDAFERKIIEEVGAMNIAFKIAGKIYTPMLSGSILPGITRDSTIRILRDEGFIVQEKEIYITEILEAAKNNTLEEAWGTGTAAVITPIGELCYKDERILINEGRPGKTAAMLHKRLTDIQYGKIEDKFKWTSLISRE